LRNKFSGTKGILADPCLRLMLQNLLMQVLYIYVLCIVCVYLCIVSCAAGFAVVYICCLHNVCIFVHVCLVFCAAEFVIVYVC